MLFSLTTSLYNCEHLSNIPNGPVLTLVCPEAWENQVQSIPPCSQACCIMSRPRV